MTRGSDKGSIGSVDRGSIGSGCSAVPPSNMEVANWRNSTNNNVTSARASQRSADSAHLRSQQAHEATRMDNFRQAVKVHDMFQEKVGHTKRMMDLLTERIQSLEASMALSKHSCSELQEARQAKRAPLELCQARVDLRHRSRPGRERKRDRFEEMLEAERDTFTLAQKILAQHASKTDKTIQELASLHIELMEDLKSKTHALHIDQDCVQTGLSRNTFHPACESEVKKDNDQLPMSMMYASFHEEQEHRRQLDTMSRLKRAKKREEQAQMQREENTRTMRQQGTACAAAHDRMQMAMDRNIQDLQHVIARLRFATTEQESRVNQTMETLGRTGDEMASHEGPVNLAHTRLNLRRQRHQREDIKDPVRDALDAQVRGLNTSYDHLEARQAGEKEAMAELQRVHAALRQDYADKQAALETDLKCQKGLRVEDMPSYQPSEHSRKMLTKTLASVGVGVLRDKSGDRSGITMRSSGSSVQGPMSARARGKGYASVPLKIGTYATSHRWGDAMASAR